jgi:DNA-directed RNA polymerase subunit L
METIANVKYGETIIDIENPIIKEYKKWVVNLIPDINRTYVKFELLSTDCSVANAIRRTVMSELQIKVLYAPTVDTNDDYTTIEDVQSRINFIPLKQSCSADAKFSLDVANSGHEHLKVYSRSITPSKNFSRSISLAELDEGRYIKIPEIKVESGYGTEHAKFSYTGSVGYCNLDYRNVVILNEKGNFINNYVLVEDLYKYTDKKDRPLIQNKKKRILIIPDPMNEKFATKLVLDNLPKRFQLIVHLTNGQKIPHRSSLNNESHHFGLRINTPGTIPIKDLVPMVCDNIIGRLEKTKLTTDKNLKKYPKGYVFTIYETATIAELLRKRIYKTNPTIAFIKTRYEDPRDKIAHIDIIVGNPKKTIEDACDSCIKTFKKIKTYF